MKNNDDVLGELGLPDLWLMALSEEGEGWRAAAVEIFRRLRAAGLREDPRVVEIPFGEFRGRPVAEICAEDPAQAALLERNVSVPERVRVAIAWQRAISPIVPLAVRTTEDDRAIWNGEKLP